MNEISSNTVININYIMSMVTVQTYVDIIIWIHSYYFKHVAMCNKCILILLNTN